MAYKQLTVMGRRTDGYVWAFYATGLSLGGDDGFAVGASDIMSATDWNTHQELRMDGLTITYIAAAARTITPRVFSTYGGESPYTQHTMDTWTHTPTRDSRACLLDGLPVWLNPGQNFVVAYVGDGLTVAGDICHISAWGTFPSVAGVQPVSLEGYKWPLTRR